MKRFALLLYSSPLFAQTPVDTGSSLFSFNPVVIAIVAVGAIAAGIYFYHRKHPTAGAAQVQSALDLMHKHADAMNAGAAGHDATAQALQTQAETIKAQAAIIASPPIQAVINTSPAAGTGQGGLQRPAALYTPLPVTTIVSQPRGAPMHDPNYPPSSIQSAGEGRAWYSIPAGQPGAPGYFYDLKPAGGGTGTGVPAGTQEQNVLLALSWIPGPVGQGFRAQLDATFPSPVEANAFVDARTNYSWNAAAVQVQGGADPAQIVANLKAQTYPSAWDSLPALEDVQLMKTKLGV